jgi:hypothetical protein
VIGMEINVSRSTALPVVAHLAAGLEAERFLPYLAEATTQQVEQHLRDLDERPNRLGGARTHYFQQASEHTTWEIDGDTALIRIQAPGINLRYFGGVIRAGVSQAACGPTSGRATRYLTIPAAPEAYGRRACDIPDLVVLWGRNGPYALGRRSQRSQAVQGGGGTSAEFREVLFILKESVTVAADPTVLPTPEAIAATIKQTFADYVSALKEEAESGAEILP